MHASKVVLNARTKMNAKHVMEKVIEFYSRPQKIAYVINVISKMKTNVNLV